MAADAINKYMDYDAVAESGRNPLSDARKKVCLFFSDAEFFYYSTVILL